MSDRHGRVPILSILCVVELFRAINTILLVTHPDELGMKWAYFGATVSGLFGGT